MPPGQPEEPMGDEREDRAPEPWERVEVRQLAEYEMFGVREDHSRSPRDGRIHTFHVAESPGGVVVIALTEAGQVVMVEQFRHGPRRVGLELPSGVVDEGEAPAEAAARELREETGYAGGRAELLGTIELNPSWQSTRVHVALVRGARLAGETDPDAGEDLRVRLISPAELGRRVRQGEVDAGATLAALALWQLLPGSAAPRG
jgi:ADP-ribose pyrophosphatase